MNDEKCPRCGYSPLDCDEADVGVGVIRGNYGCPNCHWTEADGWIEPKTDGNGWAANSGVSP